MMSFYLAFNFFSITSASKKGKVTTFSKMKCEIADKGPKLLATGYRERSLYYLKHSGVAHQACTSRNQTKSKGIGNLGIWILLESNNRLRRKWLRVWMLTTNKSLISVSVVYKVRVTSCRSSPPPLIKPTIHLISYTVMFAEKLELHPWEGVSILLHFLMIVLDMCGYNIVK